MSRKYNLKDDAPVELGEGLIDAILRDDPATRAKYPRARKSRFTEADFEGIRRDRELGMTYPEISRKYQISASYAQLLCTRGTR